MAGRQLSSTDLDLILNRTAPLWEEMRNQQIFLTGGTGFFGCWLLESFSHINRQLSLNARGTVLARDPAAFASKCPQIAADPSLAFLKGDVRSFDFPDGEFRFVIHAATEASAKQASEQPIEMLTTIIDGTERTLDFAQTHATRKLLLTSSGAVYGKQPENLTHIPEEYLGGPDPLDPASIYAEGKRISEQMCALCATQSRIEIKIFPWTRTSRSATSSETSSPAGRFESTATALPVAPICTPPILRYGYGRCSSRLRVLSQSM